MKKNNIPNKKQGFTLMEIMIAISIGTTAMAGIMTVFISCLHSIARGETSLIANSSASMTVERIVKGSSTTTGLRQFCYTDFGTVTNSTGNTYSDSPTNGYVFNSLNQTISDLHGNTIANNVVAFDINKQSGSFEFSIEVKESNGQFNSTQSYKTKIYARNF